jgi:hypothetical protein
VNKIEDYQAVKPSTTLLKIRNKSSKHFKNSDNENSTAFQLQALVPSDETTVVIPGSKSSFQQPQHRENRAWPEVSPGTLCPLLGMELWISLFEVPSSSS